MKTIRWLFSILSIISLLSLHASCHRDASDSMEPLYGVKMVMQEGSGTSGSVNLTQGFIQIDDKKIYEGDSQFQADNSDVLMTSYRFIKNAPDGDVWLIEIDYKGDTLEKEFFFQGEPLILYQRDSLTVLLDKAEK